MIYKCSNWAQKTLWEDREIVLHAVQQNGLVLTEADEDFIYDMEVLQAAVKQNWTLPLNGNLLWLQRFKCLYCLRGSLCIRLGDKRRESFRTIRTVPLKCATAPISRHHLFGYSRFQMIPTCSESVKICNMSYVFKGSPGTWARRMQDHLLTYWHTHSIASRSQSVS